jgi:hypothetical protein
MIEVTYIQAKFESKDKSIYRVFAVNEWQLGLMAEKLKPTYPTIVDKVTVTIDRWNLRSPNSRIFRSMCEYAAGCTNLAIDEDAPFKDIYTENARKLFILEDELRRDELCLDRNENAYLGASWEALLKNWE